MFTDEDGSTLVIADAEAGWREEEVACPPRHYRRYTAQIQGKTFVVCYKRMGETPHEVALVLQGASGMRIDSWKCLANDLRHDMNLTSVELAELQSMLHPVLRGGNTAEQNVYYQRREVICAAGRTLRQRRWSNNERPYSS
jgi:hypothetical protein